MQHDGPFGQRPSASADEAREREIARITALSTRERALLALRLGRRSRAWAEQAKQAKRPR